jgi:hypothetical protein
MRTLLLVTLLCLSTTAAAAVYRWQDKDGVVHYSDTPPSPQAQPAQLPNLQTYPSGTVPPVTGAVTQAPAPAAATTAPVTITSPAQDETIRDAQGKFTVSVSGTVPDGAGLVYYLDGSAQNKTPTPSQAYLYSGVDRGDHQLSVALISAGGAELGRSADVTIHMMQPTVGMYERANPPAVKPKK